jgi:hypothetical protein
VAVGRVFGEHVFTRLFAASASERKVLRFDDPRIDPIPAARYVWQAPAALLELPPGADPLDEALRPEGHAIAFGLSHTDSNQHVNSLVYPRLFEDAVLTRLSALGLGTKLPPRTMEIAYRKPFFAGDRAFLLVRAFRLGGALGAVGSFVPAAAPKADREPTETRGSNTALGAGPPSCTLRILFDR